MSQSAETFERHFEVNYRLDDEQRIYYAKILSRSAEAEDILEKMDRNISRSRIKLIAAKPTRRRRRGVAIENGVYRRFVPSKWTAGTIARTDGSLEAFTDVNVKIYEVEVEGQLILQIDMEDARNALGSHPWREDKLSISPFNIDFAKGEIEGKPVRMKIIRCAA